MLGKNAHIRCTRCRHDHTEAERVDRPGRIGSVSCTDSTCPRCSCKSYFDLAPQVAWCWSSGLIEFGDAMPAPSADGGGAIQIAMGPKYVLKARISALARHGYGANAGKLLVPGVSEAEDQRSKGDALAAWLSSCRKRKNGEVTFAGQPLARATSEDHPFKAGIYHNIQTYHATAEDRIKAVKSFSRSQCEAAMKLVDLQKTVERAVQAQIRLLDRLAAKPGTTEGTTNV